MKWGMSAMKSQTFSFNRGIIKQNLKQHGWIGIVYLVGLLFALPLQIMMLTSNENVQPKPIDYYQHFQDYFDFNMEIQTVLLFTIPILAGIILFRYLQIKESVDMTHSLPVRRENLYFNHMMSGFLLLLPPIWITGIMTWFALYFSPFIENITTTDLLIWIGIMSLFTVFSFVLSVFVGMITGLSVAQGILIYIFLFLPFGLITLISYHLDLILYGFSASYYGAANLSEWSPITRFTNFNEVAFTWKETFLYLFLVSLFIFLGYLLYKYRQLEAATQVITFSLLRPILKYGVTFSFMLIAGAYFASSQNHKFSWIVFGYIFGGLIGYLVAEMFLMKTWRIFKWRLIPSLIGYTVVISLIFFGIHADVTGFVSKVPKKEEIKGIYFGYSYYDLRDKLMTNENPFATDPEFIQSVRKLHEFIIQKQPKELDLSQPSRPIFIAYQLTNGNNLVREYRTSTETIESGLKPVMETTYYKTQHYQLRKLDKSIEKIRFYQPMINKSLYITDPQEIDEVKQILKEEILAMNYEEMVDTRSPWANIDLLSATIQTNIKQEAPMYEWKKSYYHLEEWLVKKGYLDKARILPEEIKYIEVAKANNKTDKTLPPEASFEPVYGNKGEIIKINDQALISQALEQYGYSIPEESLYHVRFTTVQGEQFYGTFTNENIPAFIPNLFNKND